MGSNGNLPEGIGKSGFVVVFVVIVLFLWLVFFFPNGCKVNGRTISMRF